MSVFDKLPLALLPHHDGSALYVPNQKPRLGDSIKIRIRIHKALGAVKELRVRFSESGEAFPSAPAKVVKREAGWSWYETQITIHNPKMNYRFMIVMSTGDILWYNTLGLHELIPPDINDFRLNTFSSAPDWGKSCLLYTSDAADE